MTDRETATEIDRAAMRWAVLADDGPLRAEQRGALDAWLQQDVRRLGAYARARAGFAAADRAQALGVGFDPDAYRGRYAAPPSVPPITTGRLLDRPARRRGLLVGGLGVAATAVGIAGFSWQAAAQTVATARGEVRLVPLADGSTMTLNTETTARIHTTGDCQVELLQGEAIFDIVPQRGRCFTVAIGTADVRTFGGSFAVTNLADRPVALVVQRGRTEVRRGLGPRDAATVTADTMAVLRRERPTAVNAIAPDAMARALAWREGRLSFEDVPLRRAAAEFARYSDTRILFADPRIGDLTVTGLFSANDPTGFARAVAIGLDLEARDAPQAVELGLPTKKV